MKFLKLYEDFGDVQLVLIKKDRDYYRYAIVVLNEKVGMIEFYINRYTLEIASIEINKDKRGGGFGKSALKKLVKMYKKDNTIHYLTADCVSQESFFTFVSVYGKPDMFDTYFKEFTEYDEVIDFLPKTAPYDSEGHMIGGSDNSVSVRYDFKKLAKKIK